MDVCAVAVAGRGLVDPGDPVFAADDDAHLRGRSVFETTRVYGGKPFLLDRHLARFAVSAQRLRLPPPDDAEPIHLPWEDARHGGVYWLDGTTLRSKVLKNTH